MAQPSDNEENHVMKGFDYLKNECHDLYALDEKLLDLIYKIRKLREDRLIRRKDFVKKIKANNRNYGSTLFDLFRAGLIEIISDLNDSYFVRSMTLDWLKGKMIAIKTRGVNGHNEDSSRKRKIPRKANVFSGIYGYRNNLKRAKKVGKFEGGVKEIAAVHNVPIWEKSTPDVIKISNGTEVNVVNVYDPGYYPNPFSDFMENVSGKK